MLLRGMASAVSAGSTKPTPMPLTSVPGIYWLR
jgi:hypothetical protein